MFCSVGLELFEQIPEEPDIVLVCCGGGGIFAAVSASLNLYGWKKARVYGVEPENGLLKNKYIHVPLRPLSIQNLLILCAHRAPLHPGSGYCTYIYDIGS